MRRMSDWGGRLTACALVIVSGSQIAEAARISTTMDRRFPAGLYCPLDHRDFDLTFYATAPTATITVRTNNEDAGFPLEQSLDNFAIVTKTVFDSHLVVTPDFEFCYFDPGEPNAPSYDFNASGTPEVVLQLFDANAAGWDLSQHAYFRTGGPGGSAPRDPATGNDTTGGSLGLGQASDGNVQVVTSRAVSGLVPGTRYVVSGWWYTRDLVSLEISVDPACRQLDPDGDGFNCQTDCDDSDGTIWATPGETRDLLLTHNRATATTTLTWNLPASPGGSSLIYDVIRTDQPYDFFTPSVCVETNDGPNRTAVDTTTPPLNTATFFVVRAEDRCRQGIGTIGFDSTGVERIGRSCAPSSCGHTKCAVGGPLMRECDFCEEQICFADPYCCNIGWDSACVSEVLSVCNSVICPSSQGTCAHNLCVTGGPLSPSCDSPPVTPSCTAAICGSFPSCCNSFWDDLCVSQVGFICGRGCF